MTFVEQFIGIIAGLRAAIAAVAGQRGRAAAWSEPDRKACDLLCRTWSRIGRMAQRLQSLFTRFEQGTLPAPRPRRLRTPRPAPATSLDRPRYPSGRLWLTAITGYHVAGRACQLEHQFATPEWAAFLTAAPQAGRILRPLCHMLGIPVPPQIALPPRIRAPRRRPPRTQPVRPPLPAPQAGTASRPPDWPAPPPRLRLVNRLRRSRFSAA